MKGLLRRIRSTTSNLWAQTKAAISPFIGRIVTFMRTSSPFVGLAIKLAVGILIGALLIMVFSPHQKNAQTSPTNTNRPGWAMKTSVNYDNNRWYKDGIEKIKNAKNDAQALDALALWLDKTKRDPILFAATINQIITGKSSDVTSGMLISDPVVDDNGVTSGWSTDLAIQLSIEVESVIENSKVTLSDAPASGYNTGVNNGTVVTSANQGISGDRKAIQIILPNQKKIWVLGRCGNIALPGKPSLPTGKTDNPTTPIPTETTIPISTPTPTVPPVIIITTPAPTPTPTSTSSHHHGGGGSSSYTQPKSSDPADYRKPGDDNTNGSGTGTMSPRPVVTSAPSTPAPVQTSRGNGSGVTDSSTSAPGSSSGATAPGASNNSGSSGGGSSVPRSVPPPAAPAPPASNDGGNVNTGTPVNPF